MRSPWLTLRGWRYFFTGGYRNVPARARELLERVTEPDADRPRESSCWACRKCFEEMSERIAQATDRVRAVELALARRGAQ